jgi:hypothetical protein
MSAENAGATDCRIKSESLYIRPPAKPLLCALGSLFAGFLMHCERLNIMNDHFGVAVTRDKEVANL